MNCDIEALLMEIYFQRCVETGMKPEKVKKKFQDESRNSRFPPQADVEALKSVLDGLKKKAEGISVLRGVDVFTSLPVQCSSIDVHQKIGFPTCNGFCISSNA